MPRIHSPQRLFALLLVLTLPLGPARAGTPRPTALRIEVSIAPDLAGGQAHTGRLLVVLGPPDGGEPRLSVGRTGMDAPPILGRDVTGLAPGRAAILDDRSAIFPIESLGQLRPGTSTPSRPCCTPTAT